MYRKVEEKKNYTDGPYTYHLDSAVNIVSYLHYLFD